jgi:hypothetical protein
MTWIRPEQWSWDDGPFTIGDVQSVALAQEQAAEFEELFSKMMAKVRAGKIAHAGYHDEWRSRRGDPPGTIRHVEVFTFVGLPRDLEAEKQAALREAVDGERTP